MSSSAEKQIRVSQKKQLHNKAVRSLAKTNIKKAESLISSSELESAEKAVLVAVSTLDRAAEKGVIHTNNAARHKARLMKKLNVARAETAKAEVKPEKKPTRRRKAQ